MGRVVHFEIAADDLGRCEAFYHEVFAWTFQRWDGPAPYVLVKTGDGPRGIDGGLQQRMSPAQGTVNTIEVDSVDATVAAVAAKGGSLQMPKMAIPGVGWLAYCKDTEGNLFGVMQPDASAH